MKSRRQGILANPTADQLAPLESDSGAGTSMCPIVPPNIIEFPSSGWALFEIPQFDKIRPTDRTRSQNAGHHSTDGWLSLVEGTGFENRRRGNSSGGSNPSPSALFSHPRVVEFLNNPSFRSVRVFDRLVHPSMPRRLRQIEPETARHRCFAGEQACGERFNIWRISSQIPR